MKKAAKSTIAAPSPLEVAFAIVDAMDEGLDGPFLTCAESSPRPR